MGLVNVGTVLDLTRLHDVVRVTGQRVARSALRRLFPLSHGLL